MRWWAERLGSPAGPLLVGRAWAHSPPRGADESNACSGLGGIYADRHEYDKALSYFTCAIRLKPSEVDHYINRARLYMVWGRYKNAELSIPPAFHIYWTLISS